MSSGIKANAKLVEICKDMKTKKNRKVLVCKVEDEVVEDKDLDDAWDEYARCHNDDSWECVKKFMTEEFTQKAKESCRYVFLDVPVKKSDTKANDKLKMISCPTLEDGHLLPSSSWNTIEDHRTVNECKIMKRHPLNCKVKDRMLLSSSKGNLKKAAEFGEIEDIEADDESDLRTSLETIDQKQ